MSKIYEMAKKYYPRLWDEERVRALGAAGKLSEEEMEAILKGEKG